MTDDVIEPYYTDAQVAAMLDPDGVCLRPRSIRSEREAGRLVGTRIAGRWLYRRSDVLAFLEAARCPSRAPTRVASGIRFEPHEAAERPKPDGPNSTGPITLPAIFFPPPARKGTRRR